MKDGVIEGEVYRETEDEWLAVLRVGWVDPSRKNTATYRTSFCKGRSEKEALIKALNSLDFEGKPFKGVELGRFGNDCG